MSSPPPSAYLYIILIKCDETRVFAFTCSLKLICYLLSSTIRVAFKALQRCGFSSVVQITSPHIACMTAK